MGLLSTCNRVELYVAVICDMPQKRLRDLCWGTLALREELEPVYLSSPGTRPPAICCASPPGSIRLFWANRRFWAR